MPLAACTTPVDSSGRELIEHGITSFPIACYYDDLSENEVPWHWHEEWEAGVILEGTGLFAAGKEKFVLHAGEGFFVNSQVLHGCWDLDASGSKYHSVVFHPRLVGGSLDSVFYQDYVQPLSENHALECLHLLPEIQWHREAVDRIEEAWRFCVEEPFGYEFRVRNCLSELTLLLQRNIPAARKQPGEKALRDAERIKWMLQYIHGHFTDPLNTHSIAESASISESECLRCFRATIGTTPIQYVRRYRIQKAVQLLTTTELPVCVISEQCGFQDVSYFTKTFREMKGCAPTAFRRK